MTPERTEALRRVLVALEEACIPKAVIAAAFDLHPKSIQVYRRAVGLTDRFVSGSSLWTPEDDLAIKAALGMADALARLPHRTTDAIKLRKKTLGVHWPRGTHGKAHRVRLEKARNRADREVMIPLQGEAWAELPEYGVRVSSLGRVSSRGTCLLLTIKRNQVSCMIAGRRHYVPTRTLFARAFGQQAAPALHPKFYTSAEDAIVMRSRTAAEAIRSLPGRSLGGLFQRAAKLGKKFDRSEWEPRRSVSVPFKPHSDSLWSRANAAVPRALPDHLRDDLISDMVVMFLEGFTGTPAEAFKAARTAHNRLTGAFIERSAFDTIGGTTIRLIDTFETGSSL